MSKEKPDEQYCCNVCGEIFKDEIGAFPHDATPTNVECPKCGEERLISIHTEVVWNSGGEITNALINGVHYVKSPSGNWVPDYSVSGTKEAIDKSVDEAYDDHWPIGRWRE